MTDDDRTPGDSGTRDPGAPGSGAPGSGDRDSGNGDSGNDGSGNDGSGTPRSGDTWGSREPASGTGTRSSTADSEGATRTAPHRSRSVGISGIAKNRRGLIIGGVVAVGAVGLAVALASGDPSTDGVVATGADGQDYVIPENAERPVYASREDCLADVQEQIAQLQAQGEQVGDDPEQLCESTDEYRGHYAGGYWIGPLIFASSRWNSTRATSWAPVGSGGFAARGATQPDVVQKAPAGSTVGSKATLSGGFGSSGKSGFGSSAGG
ncbi:hypothetical protein [Rathayibacter tritici]|uniref:Uncharacterized protein n=1 Tax=Rathayibacter tritici TaxID=33888 RepID=A0A160KVA3_9MICO|nr:hypothetical protein [Rathayibacter tritici]AND17866.1 hypothetical protein A6122_2757 [Rathayibacter tritici]PPF30578.1 hypothetical protein C5C06_04900 [Rathayibacter tritici]PPI17876.1 hypothetical protein C5D07_04295 [Rathayibacter tritici]PPI47152.1 hypothetical protein C5D18_04285 [Rathayibacter tritici]